LVRAIIICTQMANAKQPASTVCQWAMSPRSAYNGVVAPRRGAGARALALEIPSCTNMPKAPDWKTARHAC
jgi:hypothetical protein